VASATPNALVAFLEGGIEVVHLFSGGLVRGVELQAWTAGLGDRVRAWGARGGLDIRKGRWLHF